MYDIKPKRSGDTTKTIQVQLPVCTETKNFVSLNAHFLNKYDIKNTTSDLMNSEFLKGKNINLLDKIRITCILENEHEQLEQKYCTSF